jgi:hypothetical protein
MAANLNDPNTDPSTGLPWGQTTQSGSWVRNADGSVTGPDGKTYPADGTLPDGTPVSQITGGTLGGGATVPINTTQDPTTGVWNTNKPPAAAATTTSTTGGAAPPATLGNLLSPFTGSYTQPPPVNLGGPAGIPYIPPVPQLNLPAFQKPTLEEAQNDPGYQLAQQQAQAGIESSAAAKGLVRSGGTLNDILNFNQNMATTH